MFTMPTALAAQLADADLDLVQEIAAHASSDARNLSRSEAIQAITEALEVPLSSARLDAFHVRNALRGCGFTLEA